MATITNLETFLAQTANAPVSNSQTLQSPRMVEMQTAQIGTDIFPKSYLEDAISTKPVLVTKSKLEALQQDISLVAFDPLAGLVANQDKPFSPRLINWVEPYLIAGLTKTAFYTEVNSGLKVGDRVFIIGGNYCCDALIQTDKYKKGRDGYRVIAIDNCFVVLDIDYTGVLPWNDVEDDQFFKVYYIRNRNEFIQANRQVSTRGGFSYKFGRYQNNIAFIDQQYSAITGWGKTLGAFSTPGFLVKNDNLNTTWLPIPLVTGSYSFALSPTYSNVGRIKIMNGTFTYLGKEYKQGYVYKYVQGPTQSTWEVDVTYLQPFLTKTNFRDGDFTGTWNTGLYGKQNSKISWQGLGTWNSGTLLNTEWKTGTINSKFTLPESYFTTFDQFGQPYQKENLPNNNGRSFNYIIDSDILTSKSITRGNFFGTLFGTFSISNSTVENYILSATESFPVSINRAFIQSSELNNTFVELSEINDSRHINSKVATSKIVNSFFLDSVVRESSYTSDNSIKILGYDEFIMSEKLLPGGSTYSANAGAGQKVYKFYIDEEDYRRLENSDTFFIRGLKINDNSTEILNFFDKKFRLTSWTEYIDYYSTTSSISNLPVGVVNNQFYKRGIEFSAFLTTSEENNSTFTSVTNGVNYYTDVVGTNPKKSYSVDIITSLYDIQGNTFSEVNFNRDLATSSNLAPTLPGEIGSIIDVSNAFIVDSSFESGIIEKSDWNSGVQIEYNYDTNITKNDQIGGLYNLTVSTSSQTLAVTVSYNSQFNESEGLLYSGKTIFLSAVDYVIDGIVTGITVSFGGSSYSSTQALGVTGSVGSNLTINVTASLSGTLPIISAEIATGGWNYTPGEVLTVLSGNNDATITVLSVTQSVTRIPDAYRISSISGSSLTLKELYTGTNSVLATLGEGGYFKSLGAQNRWGYLHGTKFKAVKIKSGLFRRAHITGSLIETDKYDSRDIDFEDLETAKNLVISDSIFSNLGNILSKATYIHSNFVNGSDIFNNGIVQYSIWNGMQFNLGTIKQSRWVGGTFKSGIFYNSRSFNATASVTSPTYQSENLRNWWKDGLTTATVSNDRWSWQSGYFGSQFKPEFYKSDWEFGQFNLGKFYFSKWYDGTFSEGTIGDISIQTTDTEIYNGKFLNATVDNANFISKDTSYSGTTPQLIDWQGGKFNGGIFQTDWNQNYLNSSIWRNGEFNSGEFASMARWKDGVFNNGKFTSAYGWTNSNSASQSQYGWETGKFNGGEFGNANGLTNSTWYTGEFNSGTFKGRVWNTGIFKTGIFEGSATGSAIGGTNSANANLFVLGFSQSYYGLWRDGYFTEVKDKMMTKNKLWTERIPELKREYLIPETRAVIRNALWQNGTFSHQSGEMINSVWLDGGFQAGRMTNSSFNPYVVRNGSGTQSFNLSENCRWENGQFNGGDFYISKWYGGTFELGNAWGMIWKNGTVLYMNAFNIFWEDGLWRNGNWYGSSFEFNGQITNDFEKQILFRGMSWSGTASAHYWNIFEIVDPKSKLFYTVPAATPVIDTNIDTFVTPPAN